MIGRSCMRYALVSLLGLTVLPWALAQEAVSPGDLPTAESILDRYVEETGGAAAYASRTSETATGTFAIVAAGLTGELRTFVKPGLARTTIELPGVGLIDSGVKNGVAWQSNPVAGPLILDGFAAEYTIVTAQPAAAAHWRDQYSAVETTGIEEINGEPAYRLVLSLSTGGSLTGFYSVDSGLLLKTELPDGSEQTFEEYSDLEGILTPTRVVIVSAGQRIVINVTSLEANVEIPDARFDPPEDVQALLE